MTRRLEEYESQFIYTPTPAGVRRKYAPIPTPQDRREEMPTRAEAEADER